MIYRKWSLLTGPTSILAGIVGTIVVADLLFIENILSNMKLFPIDGMYAFEHIFAWAFEMPTQEQDWLRKTDQKKQETSSSTK